MLFGEFDADLHRPAGMHRVEPTKQRAPHRHHADEVIEDRAQFLFAARRAQAFAVGLAVRRTHLQRTADQQAGDMHLGGAAVDFVAGDFAQPRHRRIGLKGRFLLGDGQHRTQVLRGRADVLRGERGVDVGGPALAIRSLRRHQPHDLRLDLGGRTRRRFAIALAGATGQGQQRGEADQ